MTEPKFKVGQEVWHVFDQGIVSLERIQVVSSWKNKVFTYLTDTGFIPEKFIFPTSAALLENIKTQVKELEK